MEWIARWRKRLRVLLRREAVEHELEEEFAFHLEMETRANLRAGMGPEAARRQAALTFGARERFREEVRDARWFAPAIGLTTDVKLALRMLAKHPALSVTGALGMAVGVAIATGFFSFMAFYYSAPPLDEGDRIVGLDYLDMGNDDCWCTNVFDLVTWRGSQRSVRQLSAFRDSDRYLRVPGGTAGGVRVAEMTASGFDVARVPPLLGRPLLTSDETEGAPGVMVIGYDEWRRNFGADRGIVGREVRLDGTPYTLVGVMPEGFRFPYNHGYWTALRSDAARHGPGEGPRVTIFGRLAPGISMAAAEAELRSGSARLAREFPAAYATFRPIVRPYAQVVLDVHQYPAWIVWTMQLFGALVLGAIAVTVAALVYARTASRQAEIAVRTALGASRRRIVTQLFVEALALSSLAAVTGLLIANVGFRQIVPLAVTGGLPYWIGSGLPASTVAYALGLAVLAAFIVSIAPALAATGQRLQSTLRQMGGATGLQLGRTWTALIVVQVAVAVAVLPPVSAIAWNWKPPAEPTFPVGEMLVLRLERGVAPAREALAAPAVERADESFAAAQAELIRRIAAEPGVLGVTYASAPPRSGQRVRIEVEGGVTTPDAAHGVAFSSGVAPNYFDVFGARVLAGRPFGSGDDAAAVVSRSFVRRFLGDGAALGRRVRGTAIAAGDSAKPGPWLEIVGVVDDLYDESVEPELQKPAIYLPAALGAAPVSVAIRTRGIDPDVLVPGLWEIAGEVAPGRPMTVAGPDELRGGGNSRGARFSVVAVGFVTLSVLLLSAAGISAMMSFAVTRRYREIGIRLALGASRRQVLQTIFSRAVLQLALGLAVGVVLVTLVDRLGGGEMLGGQHHVLVPLVAALVIAVELLATGGPASQVLRVRPMEALRQE
jgi:predicted permease